MADLAVLLFATAVTGQTSAANSQWAVHFGSGDRPQPPRCGSLQYFMGDPSDFEYDAVLVVPRPKMTKDDVRHQAVGVINGFAIHVVIHRIEYNDSEGPQTFIKIILVERTPGEMCEIFNKQGQLAEFRDLTPPFSVVVDSQTVLGTQDPVNGNCGCSLDAFWTFAKDGPRFIELRPIEEAVEEAARKLLPVDWELGNGSEFDARTFTESHGVRGSGNSGSGVIRVKFGLRDNKLVVASQEFVRLQ